MEKITRIPNLFGMDGYALPEELRWLKEPPARKEPKEDFGALLDAAIERRKGEPNE